MREAVRAGPGDEVTGRMGEEHVDTGAGDEGWEE